MALERQQPGDGALAAERNLLLDQLARSLRGEGFYEPRSLIAIARVPREEFVPAPMREHAYRNAPAEIGHEQTISQPLIVAVMAECLELRPTDRVLEIGTGSGYGAAVLSELTGEVYTVERFESLATAAARRLARLGYQRVHVRYGDGHLGWPEQAPFDGIVVTAACAQVPGAWIEQLKVGRKLVLPFEHSRGEQHLVVIERTGRDGTKEVDLGPVRFVPLLAGTVGEAGGK